MRETITQFILHPYTQIAYWLILLVFVAYMLRRSKSIERASDFNRGVADAQAFLQGGVSVDAILSYTDLMKERNRYGQYEAGLDSIAKEKA